MESNGIGIDCGHLVQGEKTAPTLNRFNERVSGSVGGGERGGGEGKRE